MRGIILGATEEILKATATFDDDGQTGSKLTTVGCARGKETKQEVWGGVVGGAVWCVALHRLCEYSAFGMNTLIPFSLTKQSGANIANAVTAEHIRPPEDVPRIAYDRYQRHHQDLTFSLANGMTESSPPPSFPDGRYRHVSLHG